MEADVRRTSRQRGQHEPAGATTDSQRPEITPVVPGARIRAPRVTGLSRERLLSQLETLWDHRLGLIVAPAGSGKSTLLAQFAAELTTPVVWYRAESSDVDAQVMLGHLEAAWAVAIGPTGRSWATADEAALALEGAAPARATIIIDDLHVLRGTASEEALERLLDYLPDGVAVLAATRALPSFNLSRLRVSGTLLELVADDLRFRSWEVERLFRDVYAEPLRPENLAELARRTEGWAAGLQLFHLATRGKSRGERERAVSALGHRSRLVREYLARNVLDELDEGLRDFLLRTAVLGRLNGHLCDELLGRSGSAAVLAELERDQLFTLALDEPGWYRYHEVLRSYAESLFIEEAGAERARIHCRRAGSLLEDAGAFVEALQAYCRADDWVAAERLLALSGEQLIGGGGPWIDSLPEAMLQHDPWVMLAAARRHRGAGRFTEALDAYRRAEVGFGAMRPADMCRQERQALIAWYTPGIIPPSDWSGLLRVATLRQPLAIAGQQASRRGPMDAVVAGVATLLAGRVDEAAVMLSEAADAATAPAVIASAALGVGLCEVLAGRGDGAAWLQRAVEAAETAGISWMASFARAVGGVTGANGETVDSADIWTTDDPWAGGCLGFLRSLLALRGGEPASAQAGQAAARFADVGAPVLEAWCTSLEALALTTQRSPDAPACAVRAERLARTTAAPGPTAIAALAGALASGVGTDRAVQFVSELGLAVGDAVAAAPPANNQPPSLAITMFGHFSIVVDGRPVDLATAKPRVRSLLRLLASRAGRPVHRERIIEALWPEADNETGTRNLQVAISSLRQVLEPGVARGESALLRREGDAYLLAIDDDATVDAVQLLHATAAGHDALRQGSQDRAIAAFDRALALYAGEMMPEEGPADWLNDERERYRTVIIEASFALAEVHAAQGELVAAAFACERGLRVDRYRDSLWRLLINLYERGGETAAAARSREQYRAVLSELGVEPDTAR